MNLITFGLILSCCHAWGTKTDIDWTYSNTIEKALENLKPLMRKGGLGGLIPVLDPFIAPHLAIKLNTSTSRGKIDFDGDFVNVNVTGLSNYTVNSAALNVPAMKFSVDLFWPRITKVLNYSMKANFFGNKLDGAGRIYGDCRGIRLILEASLELKGQYIQIKKLKTQISLEKLVLEMTGLCYDEEKSKELSKMLSENIPKLLETDQEFVDSINQIMKELINKFLSTISFQKILKVLKELGINIFG